MKKYKIIFKIIIIIFLPQILISQEFQITYDWGEQPVLDPITSEIYYYTNSTNVVKKLSPDLQLSYITDFPSLPYFSNFKHMACYQDSPEIEKLYVYDFSTLASSLLTIIDPESLVTSYRELSFSPTSQKVLIKDILLGYYNFSDSLIHYLTLDNSELTGPIVWGKNDSSVYYLQREWATIILRYNYYTGIIDTIKKSDSQELITFDYNMNTNKLAYSLLEGGACYIGVLDLDNFHDTLIYNFNQWGAGGLIKEISFSPSGKKLIFSEIWFELSNGPLYLYDFMEDSLFQLDILTGPVEDFLWLNEDTIIYSKPTNYGGLFGYNINKSTFLKDKKLENTLPDYLIKNYPNPFNEQTTIELAIKRKSFVKLDIYSIDGRLIDNLILEVLNEGYYKFLWKAQNQYNQDLSSGIYFLKLYYKNQVFENISLHKLIFMK